MLRNLSSQVEMLTSSNTPRRAAMRSARQDMRQSAASTLISATSPSTATYETAMGLQHTGQSSM